LHATWSKEKWIAHIKEAAAKERSHISQVIHVKKQTDDEYIAELESMISRKEVRAVGGAAVAVVHRRHMLCFCRCGGVRWQRRRSARGEWSGCKSFR
jgi:hypothetical protein